MGHKPTLVFSVQAPFTVVRQWDQICRQQLKNKSSPGRYREADHMETISNQITLTSLQGPGLGSYEVIFGYDLYKTQEGIDGGRIIDPRYLSF